MSLRFIYGRAGSGKSTYCVDSICNSIKKDKEKLEVLMVPEQLSFETEKTFVKAIGSSGFNNLLVTNFKRLAYMIFKECGGVCKEHMNNSGKAMLLYNIMNKLKDEFKSFNLASTNKNFIPIISELISEMKKYNVSPEELLSLKDSLSNDSVLYNKLWDISRIYEEFESILHKGYIDSDDDLTILCEKLDSCKIFNNAEVWFDEFSGFSPKQYEIIEKLMRQGSRINITLNMDYYESKAIFDETDVFFQIKLMENKLVDMARDNGVAIEEPIILSHKPSIKFKENKELDYLERNIFNYPFVSYREETKNISIFKAINTYSEIEKVAKEILILCREENYRFKDIAVVSRSLDSYENLIKAIFNEYEIPYFIDDKKDITNNPIIVLITSVMDIFTKGWSYESIFRYLKTGLVSKEQESVDALENYILRSGIKGKKKWVSDELWKEKIFKVYNLNEEISRLRFSCEEEETLLEIIYGDSEDIILKIDKTLELLENLKNDENENKIENLKNIFLEIKTISLLRKKFITPLIEFDKALKKAKTGRELCTELFNFLSNINILEILEEKIAYFNKKENQQLVKEYSQIWNFVLELLDQIVEVLGNEELTLEEFIDILSIGFSENKMGFIPPALDQVTVGKVDRIRSHDIKVLFLIGVNDGIFPKAQDIEGLFTDTDRMYFKENGIELAKDSKSKSFEEQYLIYTTLALPKDALRISYSIADHEGKALRPSIIISRIKAIFSRVQENSDIVISNKEEEILRNIVKDIPSFNTLITSMHSILEDGHTELIYKSLYNYYEEKEQWVESLERNLKGFEYTNQSDNLDEKVISELYGENKYFSVSRIEQYMQCPFAYFIKYGLKAKERKIYELTPPDLGSFMHSVIDKFSRSVDENNLKWDEVSEQWCKKIIDEKINECVGEGSGYIFTASPRYNYFKERLKRVLLRSIALIVEHMRRGEFSPIGYEIEFGTGKSGYPPIEIELSTGDTIRLVGKIDRVDKLALGDEEYFRVIDYKSGNKDLKLSDIYYGLQVQLLTYLDAILNIEEDIKGIPTMPAGVLYFKIDDPMIASNKKLSPEEIEEEIMKKLKMKGLVLADTTIVEKMDNEIEGTSLILPVAFKKDGNFASKSRTLTKEQFDKLREHVRLKLAEACENMLSGDINIMPCKNQDSDSCAYCIYNPICNFDPTMKDNEYKVIRPLKDDEVFKLIDKELKEGPCNEEQDLKEV